MYIENEKWMYKELMKFRVHPRIVDHCAITGTFDYKTAKVYVRSKIEQIKTLFIKHGWEYLSISDDKVLYFRKHKNENS